MNNEEKVKEILDCENCRKLLFIGGVKCPPECADYNDLMKMAQWKDENPIVTANLFRHCISMLNDICYEQGTGIDETDIEYVIKVKKLP